MSFKTFLLVLVALFLFVSPALAADQPTVSSIGAKLQCLCGCGKTVQNCDDANCSFRDNAREVIQQALTAGQSEKQIIDNMVAQFGEQILVEPPKSGFNLVAWIVPFAALLGGAAVVGILATQWVKRGKGPPKAGGPGAPGGGPTPPGGIPPSDPKEEAYRRRVEKDLKDFEEKTFR